MTNAVLQKTIFLRAEPETVWAYLTDPEKQAQGDHQELAQVGPHDGFQAALVDQEIGEPQTLLVGEGEIALHPPR